MFWSQLRAATIGPTDDELLTALWDLVWAGEVTNDSMAALRALIQGRGPAGAGARGGPAKRAGAFGRNRGRPTRLGRIGPATGAGRWSLVAPLLEPKPTSTQAAHAAAMQLVERMGVVTREGVLAEGVVGGFASVYQVLKVLEERGQVRRGYFVSGLGAAQFAVPGAVDRLRSLRRATEDASAEGWAAEPGQPVVLSATDPAQPYGAALAWPDSPGRPARIGPAIVVMREGVPLVWHDRRSHHLVTFPGGMHDLSWVDALMSLVRDGPMRAVEIRKINGATLADSPDAGWIRSAAIEAGFTDSYRGLAFRRS
jgi:ATP-dependent Lhr-like helicase